MLALSLMPCLVIGQLIEEPIHLFCGYALDELPGSEALERLHGLREVGTAGNEMEVVFHGYIGIQFQSLLFSAELQGGYQDIKVIFLGKDGYPCHGC